MSATTCLPNTIVIGAPKCGTTWLYDNLRSHPNIATPRKEIHYFSNHLEMGLDWYASFFAEVDQGQRVVLDVATNYIYHHDYFGLFFDYYRDIAALIRETLGRPKLIAIVRDPVQRAFSNYINLMQGVIKYGAAYRGKPRQLDLDTARAWGITFNAPWIGDFDRQIRNFYAPATFEAALFTHPALITRGFYEVYLKHYLRTFDRDDLLVLDFEMIRRDPEGLMNTICDFLAIERWHDPAILRELSNAADQRPLPRWWTLHSRLIRLSRQPGVGSIANRLLALNLRLGGQKPRLNPRTAAVLARWFQPHNEALAGLTGLNFDHWTKSDMDGTR